MKSFFSTSTTTILIFTFVVCRLQGQPNKLPEGVLDQGKNAFKQGDFRSASLAFNALLKKYPYNAEVMYWNARCYEESDEKQKASDLFIKALKYNKNAAPDILYKVGRAYHIKQDFKKALSYFNQYKSAISADKVKKLGSSIEYEQMRVGKMIEECQNALKLAAQPAGHKVINLGKLINSAYEDYTPLVTADNKKLFFTSRRPGGMSNLKDTDNGFFEDIWYTTKDAKGKWGTPVNLGSPLNSASHDACMALSPDGKQLFVYKTSNGGDIYVSDLVNGKWSKPKSIGKRINSKYKEPSMSISADKKVLFFSSDRPGGLGGLDIYMSKLDNKGDWSEPVNLGPNINTKFEDDGPFISFDGKVLYFCSNGHNSMGGFDVFKSTFDEKTNNWSKPVNLGVPVNSPADDIFFVVTADNRTAYYASSQKGGMGENDLFTVVLDTTYLSGNKTKVLAKTPSTNKNVIVYKGKVTDESGSPLECVIHVLKLNAESNPVDYNTKKDGSFEIPLGVGSAYGINTGKSGYIFASHNIDLTKSSSQQTISVETFKLKKPKAGQKIVLKNIFYQTGKATLAKSSFLEINILYEFLINNPGVKIEISGHTDNTGSPTGNKQLSEARAKTIYDILIKKGVNAARLKFAGYGSERPIAPNTTEEGKRKNRRTEFEIVGI